MLDKVRKLLTLVFIAHILAGFVLIALLVFGSQFTIGVGRFENFVSGLERFDFKWWIVALTTVGWLLPIMLVVVYQRAKVAGMEVSQLRATLRELLQDRSIPIMVDIDDSISVHVVDPMRVPVELDTKIDIDEEVEIEADIPMSTVMSLDTHVATTVLGLGSIKIPIKAEIPIDMMIPIRGRVRIKVLQIPITIREEATVQLPKFELPVKCRLETRVDLWSNLEAAERRLTQDA